MKKVILFAIALAVATLSSCVKADYYKNADGTVTVDPGETKNSDKWTYNWQYQPQELIQAPTVSSLGVTSPRGYPSVKVTFKVSLANAKVDPRYKNITIPHVGPGGTTIYENVANDATYKVENIDKANGIATISISTDVPTNTGYVELVFNLNVDDPNGDHINWFQAYGNFAKCKFNNSDDGSTNSLGFHITITTVTPIW